MEWVIIGFERGNPKAKPNHFCSGEGRKARKGYFLGRMDSLPPEGPWGFPPSSSIYLRNSAIYIYIYIYIYLIYGRKEIISLNSRKEKERGEALAKRVLVYG